MTGLTIALLTLFIVLGRWQWGRAEFKQQLLDDFVVRPAQAEYLGNRSMQELDRYARIQAQGRWDLERQFLLDNRTREGRAGFEVLTPFELEDGRWLLVNRGWLPFAGFRDQLPDLQAGFPELHRNQLVRITGQVDELPRAGLASGRLAPALSGPWPRLTTFPETSDLAAAMGWSDPALLETRQLLLDADSGYGYRRDWAPFAAGKGPEQNWSYAIQWWSFAVVLLILYVSLNLQRRETGDGEVK
ncbi:MAG: SURF1 family protein [Steroidobacteraceae bacterium]|jgi:surfeit locus 1 family protein